MWTLISFPFRHSKRPLDVGSTYMVLAYINVEGSGGWSNRLASDMVDDIAVNPGRGRNGRDVSAMFTSGLSSRSSSVMSIVIGFATLAVVMVAAIMMVSRGAIHATAARNYHHV